MLVEFPVLVAVAAEPVATVVMPFIGKTHRDAVLAKGPDLFDQAVVELAAPLARQKRLNRRAALQKLRTVAPAAVGRVGESNPRRIARIPCVFGRSHPLRGSLGVERGKRRTGHSTVLGWAPQSTCSLRCQFEDLANLGRAGDGPRIARHPRSVHRLLGQLCKALRPDLHSAEA